MTENNERRVVSSGECSSVEVYLLGDRLRGVVQKLRGEPPGAVWYVWRGWFAERLAGPFRTAALAHQAAADRLFGDVA